MTTVEQNYREWRFERTRGLLTPGPWTDEPDKVQWIDEATGLDCLVKRGPSGALCGYVGVTTEHPWHGKDYGECVTEGCTDSDCWDYEHAPQRVIVHGGLTYAAPCAAGDPETGICHVAAPGRPDTVFWFGFDCAHGGDLSPKYDYKDPYPGDVYRDLAYVKAEVRSLARQLAEVTA